MAEEEKVEDVVVDGVNEEEEVSEDKEVDTGEVDTGEVDTEEEDSEVTGNTVTFTQEELNEIVKNRLSRKDEEFNKKLDKLVSQKLEEQKEEEQLTEEQKEAKRLEKLSKELEEKQAELDFRDRFSEAESGLRNVNLDTRFAKWLVNGDKEITTSNITEFQKLFNEAVEKKSIDKLKGRTPKANRKGKVSVVTKDKFSGMGYRERQELKLKDPKLYEELSKL